jgi:hypothetical protein
MTYNFSLLQYKSWIKKSWKVKKLMYTWIGMCWLPMNFINTTWSFLSKLSFLCALFKESWKIKMLPRGNQKTFNCCKPMDEQNMPICIKYKAFVVKWYQWSLTNSCCFIGTITLKTQINKLFLLVAHLQVPTLKH